MNLVSRITFAVVLCVISASPAFSSLTTRQKMSPKSIYKKYSPSVVHIDTKDAQGKSWTGTGFFVEDGSKIATCYHVIQGAVEIKVMGTDDATWKVESIRYDKDHDLALLRLEHDSGRDPIPCTDLKGVGPGDPVYVLGNSLGFLENSMSNGIVSGIRGKGNDSVLQFTAPISHGNSGGPVFDENGRALAVASNAFTEGENLNIGRPVNGLTRLGELVPYEQFTEKSKSEPVPSEPNDIKPSTEELQEKCLKLFAIWDNEVEIIVMQWGDAFNREAESSHPDLPLMAYFQDKYLDAVVKDSSETQQAMFELSEQLGNKFKEHKRTMRDVSSEFTTILTDNLLARRFKVKGDISTERWNAGIAKQGKSIDEMRAILDDQVWFSWSKFVNLHPNPAVRFVLSCGKTLNSEPDPDILDSASIGSAYSTSDFRIGDIITGIALNAEETPTPVNTWDDYVLYSQKHPDNQAFYLQVKRGDQTLSIWSCQTKKSSLDG